MEHLYIPKNNENIHRGSQDNIEALHDFSLNFWKAELGFKNRIELTQFWDSQFYLLFGNIWKMRKGCKMQTWNFLNNLEVQEHFG